MNKSNTLRCAQQEIAGESAHQHLPQVGARTDEREQLANGRLRGAITVVSLPEVIITSLHGILLDFDPNCLHPNLAHISILANPERLYHEVVRAWLVRHPVFAKAEVRSSGRGLHVIIWLSRAVEFENSGDRQKWAAVVKLIQSLLPTDPDCPGITALTRPVGSVNSKNGEQVRLLHTGEAVSADEVLALCAQAMAHPFATVAGLLYPSTRISPCPLCLADGSRLDILDDHGKCYGGCGKVRIGQIFDRFLRPRAAKGEA